MILSTILERTHIWFLELNESKKILDGSDPDVPEDFNILIILFILTL